MNIHAAFLLCTHALVSLVTIVVLALQQCLDKEDIARIKRYFWVTLYEGSFLLTVNLMHYRSCAKVWHEFASNTIKNRYTQVFHYLQHVPRTIELLGPMHRYSTRPLERTIGVFKKQIRSKVATAENAANQLFLTAAYRDYGRHRMQNERFEDGEDEQELDQESPSLWKVVQEDLTVADFSELGLNYFPSKILETVL